MSRLETSVVSRGHLEGLAVTGLSREGIDLLQAYVDSTGDVQTACLAMGHVVPSRFKDDRVSVWIHMYVLPFSSRFDGLALC